MTKAIKIFSRRFKITCKNREMVVVFMDLYKLADDRAGVSPEGYRFSWIAFDPEDESTRVLFDCHPPKGPHIHVDGDREGTPFEWRSLDEAQALFFEKVAEKFGAIAEEDDEE